MTRRDFIARTAAISALWPAMTPATEAAYATAPGSLLLPPGREPVVSFDEPGFPAVDAVGLRPVPGAVETSSVTAFAEALRPGALVVWRHGSAFPGDAWEPFLRFLEAGGSLLHVGGEPFTRPVVGPAGRRRVEPRTLACLKALRLNRSTRIDVPGGRVHWPGRAATRTLGPAAVAFALEPRLTDTRDFPGESGSPGARDALPRTLAHVRSPGSDSRFPVAAAVFGLDRLRGPFAGGRWTFWQLSDAPTDEEWTRLLEHASREPLDLRLDPALGCFHAGESPSLVLRLHRPGGGSPIRVTGSIAVEGAPPSREVPVVFEAAEHVSVLVPLPGTFAPGLHRATLETDAAGAAITGFWVFDRPLFASGDSLSFDGHTLRRNGAPEPLVGTTTMSARVHRDFLFEPNAAVWDDTFAELSSLKINAIRTGLWSGWKRISVDANVVDEPFLRALEAFYLTARRHHLPVIFSVFAFTPEVFGGEDPYFDPRALEGQRALLTTLARRMAPAREWIWDLINEPSFASPTKLWSLRPVRSRHERDAFLAWLRRSHADDPLVPWDDVVRRRWRLAPGEAIDLPADEDFDDAYAFGTRRPYRALDYARFAQDAFSRWAREMRAALAAGGSAAPVTVGQDEAGLLASPSPLVHHAEVHCTSMHTWWNNDALLWDGVLSKATGRPLLVSETGVMPRELLDSEAVRSAADAARLLSRKLVYAFAGGAFGVVQWCYETNPYMDSDNEVAIGLKRVDGSTKPEHAVLASLAGFMAQHRQRFDGHVAPDVALIVPTGDQLSVRNTALAATRAAIRALSGDLRVPVRAVAETRAAEDLGAPRLIVLPACRGIAEKAWQAIADTVEAGATLVCSGWFEADDAGVPASRLDLARRPLAAVEPAGGETLEVVRFPGTLPESWFAAATAGSRSWSRGRGHVLHHPLPLEWAEPTPMLTRFYSDALALARVTPRVEVEGPSALLVVSVVPFARDWLIAAVNESPVDVRVALRRPGAVTRATLEVRAGWGRLAWLDPSTWTLIDASI